MVTPAAPRGGRVLARRYHLLRVLGRGAMGAVWEAEDTVLRRTVAVKEVVLPTALSPEERALSCERTLREARAIARLGHPNVVTLFDVLDEDARPWVVMELVPSRSLADVISEDGPLHPLRVATIGLAILSALEAAHAASITHRDVKPGNILLGHDGRVKLTDFGIARSAGEDTITGTGLLVGSPSYIAPEIVKGQGAGPPADLWGLGATLYAAAEGRAPFSGGDAMDTLAKVVQEPPAPYDRSGPLVPALAAMLEKDPARRARPVDARRLLLDVLRGGNDADHPSAGPIRRASGSASASASASGSASASASASGSASGAPAAEAAAPLGPGLAELLVPVRRDEAAGARDATGGARTAGAAGAAETVERVAEPSSAPDEPAGQPAAAAPPGDGRTGQLAAGDDASPAVAAEPGPDPVGSSRADRSGGHAGAGATEDAADDELGWAGDGAAGASATAGRQAEPADGSPTGPAPVEPSRTVALDGREQERLPQGPARAPADRTPADRTPADRARAAGAADAADPSETVVTPSGTHAAARSGGATRLLGVHPGPGRPDDQPTQLVAPLPFGSPAGPARPVPPLPPGRRPGPGESADPFGFPAERPPADRRRRTVAALLAVLGLLLAAVVGGALLLNGVGGSGDGGSRAATGAPSAAPAAAAIPAGYTSYRGDGFTVGVPVGWTPESGRSGVVDVRAPERSRFLRLITVGGSTDAVSQLTAAEAQFSANPAYAPYEKIRLGKVDYRGYPAADWEFTFTSGGTRRHVLYRGVVIGGRTFGLYLSVPADRWESSRAVFQTVADTFRPDAGG